MQTKDHLARFCFKCFDFTLRAKTLSKINFAFKMVRNWFVKENSCEKIFSATFPKRFAKLKWVFKNLVSKVLISKGFSENQVLLQKIYLSNKKCFQNNFETSFVVQTKGKQRLFRKLNRVFKKSLDLKSFKKCVLF